MEKTYRIYGAAGHRQRLSFGPSRDLDFSTGPYARPVQLHVGASDETGTNDYIKLTITAPDEETIKHELFAQIEDGILENSRVGDVIDDDTGAQATEAFKEEDKTMENNTSNSTANLKVWRVRTVYPSIPDLKVSGTTLLDAVSADLGDIAAISRSDGNMICDTRLQRLYYSDSILGGNGGYVAEIACVDMVTNAPRIITAWIYADADGNPV